MKTKIEQQMDIAAMRMNEEKGREIEREIFDYLVNVIDDDEADVDTWTEAGRDWCAGKWQGSIELEALPLYVDVRLYFRYSYKSGVDNDCGPYCDKNNFNVEVSLDEWRDRETDEPCDAPAYVDALEIEDEIKWLLRN